MSTLEESDWRTHPGFTTVGHWLLFLHHPPSPKALELRPSQNARSYTIHSDTPCVKRYSKRSQHKEAGSQQLFSLSFSNNFCDSDTHHYRLSLWQVLDLMAVTVTFLSRSTWPWKPQNQLHELPVSGGCCCPCSFGFWVQGSLPPNSFLAKALEDIPGLRCGLYSSWSKTCLLFVCSFEMATSWFPLHKSTTFEPGKVDVSRLVLLLFVCFETESPWLTWNLCKPGWPLIHWDSPASAPAVLGLKEYTTTLDSTFALNNKEKYYQTMAPLW